MTIILFGPPGIGKSTLVGELKTRGASAIDLEDLYPSRVRFDIPNFLAPWDNLVFLGAADLSPGRRYPNAIKVLLVMEQAAYEKRRAHRDALRPGKAGQAQHLMKDWVTSDYDLLLDITNLSAGAVAKKLLRYAHAFQRRSK